MIEAIEDWVLDFSAKTVWRTLEITYLLVMVVTAFIRLVPHLLGLWRGYMKLTPEQRENHWLHPSRKLKQQQREPMEPYPEPAVITMAGFLPDE